MTAIALDIDDTIADSTEALRIQVNQVTGSFLTQEDYQESGEYYRYYEKVWKKHSLPVTYEDLHTDMAIDQSHIPVLKGAKKAVSSLSQEYDIVAVTARNPLWKKATYDWLDKEFPDVFREVAFTSNEGNLQQYQSKGVLCKYLGASLLIDDNPEHCETALAEGVKAILFGKYGWHIFTPKRAIACKSWQEVEEYFNGA